ncbi:MAG: SAM-dependent methyltransferase, partial [Anaerolineales bacterium]
MSNPAPEDRASPAVRRYYEQNTRFFLSFGRPGGTRTIHRAVWGPGVSDRKAALSYTNRLIYTYLLELTERQPEMPIRAADLGCGVGGSLFYLASRMPQPFWGLGLTISPSQARLAQRHAAQLNLQSRCAFIEADFQRPPLVSGWQAIFSIEAFAHAPNPQGYLQEAARMLVDGGRLMLCDDFLAGTGKEENFWLRAFRTGWQVPGLRTVEQVKVMGQACGLELSREQDLTPYLRLSPVPGWLARWLVGASA